MNRRHLCRLVESQGPRCAAHQVAMAMQCGHLTMPVKDLRGRYIYGTEHIQEMRDYLDSTRPGPKPRA